MTKKKVEETGSGYSYDKALEGSTVWADKKYVLGEKTSQKDLQKLYSLGVKGIVKL